MDYVSICISIFGIIMTFFIGIWNYNLSKTIHDMDAHKFDLFFRVTESDQQLKFTLCISNTGKRPGTI